MYCDGEIVIDSNESLKEMDGGGVESSKYIISIYHAIQKIF